MNTKRTKKGWTIEDANGRKVLYREATLVKEGVAPYSDPKRKWNDYVSCEEHMLGAVCPDMILRRAN